MSSEQQHPPNLARRVALAVALVTAAAGGTCLLWRRRDSRWLSGYVGWTRGGNKARCDAGQARPDSAGNGTAGHDSSASSAGLITASAPAAGQEAGSEWADSTASAQQSAVQRYPDYIAWAAAQSDLGREKRLLNLYRAGLVRLLRALCSINFARACCSATSPHIHAAFYCVHCP